MNRHMHLTPGSYDPEDYTLETTQLEELGTSYPSPEPVTDFDREYTLRPWAFDDE